jgi:hypothetical protein
MASVIHVIDQVRNPVAVYHRIAHSALAGTTVIDLTAGRVGGASQLETVRGGTVGDLDMLRTVEYLSQVASPTREAYVRWIGEVADRAICDEKSIKQWFTYNDEVSLWWLTRTAQKAHRSWRWLFFAFGMIDLMYETGKAELGTEWHLWVPKHEIGRMLGDYIGERGRPVIHSDAPPCSGERPLVGLKRRILTPLQRVLNALSVTRYMDQDREGLDKPSPRRGRILVATQFPRSWKAIPEEERAYPSTSAFDFYLGYLPWKLRDEGFEVLWLKLSASAEGYDTWKQEAVEKQDISDGSAWAALSVSAAARILRHHVRWCLDFDYLFRRTQADLEFTYQGVAIGDWIVDDYRNMCLGSGVSAMIDMEQYRQAVETLQPKAVLYRDEMFTSGRLISAGMKGRTHLVGLQHGIIIDEATTYVFDKNEVGRGEVVADHVRYCPVPDIFASFGEYVREAFARWGGYPPERVIPIGGVRHDQLVEHHVLQLKDGTGHLQLVRQELGLPFDRRIVALFTQEAKEAGRWFELVVQALGEIGEAMFIAVKLHHYHGGEEAVKAVAGALAFRDYKLIEAHTYPLIASADLVVSGPSTIVLESYLLDTPVISIFESDDYEAYPYRKEGLGIVVNSQDTMNQALKKLASKIQSDDASERRRTVLRRHLWNDDGLAYKRLIGILEDQVSS